MKELFGKTIKIAKQTAQQIYGDDLAFLPERYAGSDPQNNTGSGEDRHSNQPKRREGVSFERSNSFVGAKEKKINDSLQSVRQYAAQQTSAEQFKAVPKVADHFPDKEGRTTTADVQKPEISTFKKADQGVYSRANIRSNSPTNHSTGVDFANALSEQVEENALHEDDSQLASLNSNFSALQKPNYVSHPTFQQLIGAGVDEMTVSTWFREIIGQSVDPFKQPDLLRSKLSNLVEEALEHSVSTEANKFQLFAGPAGSGKTHLIMKLSRNTAFMLGKKVGIASISPTNGQHDTYYTILEPFCKDKGFSYFQIKDEEQIEEYWEEWESFDHILIDTPSLGTSSDSSLLRFREMTASLDDLAIHYVINASSATPDPHKFLEQSTDIHVAITHLDVAAQRAALFPLKFKNNLRYVSVGSMDPEQLEKFEPKWFVDQLLGKSNFKIFE